MKRLLLLLLAVFSMAGLYAPTAEARQDVYAYTYHGNNWYVDKDSIRSNMPDGLLHYTVYTQIGLEYDVASGNEYYNADVYYNGQKLSTEGGQLLYKNPGMLATSRVARQLRQSMGNTQNTTTAAVKPAAITPPAVSNYTAQQAKQQHK